MLLMYYAEVSRLGNNIFVTCLPEEKFLENNWRYNTGCTKRHLRADLSVLSVLSALLTFFLLPPLHSFSSFTSLTLEWMRIYGDVAGSVQVSCCLPKPTRGVCTASTWFQMVRVGQENVISQYMWKNDLQSWKSQYLKKFIKSKEKVNIFQNVILKFVVIAQLLATMI